MSTSKPNVSEHEARAVAGGGREATWVAPSFVSEVCLGTLGRTGKCAIFGKQAFIVEFSAENQPEVDLIGGQGEHEGRAAV